MAPMDQRAERRGMHVDARKDRIRFARDNGQTIKHKNWWTRFNRWDWPNGRPMTAQEAIEEQMAEMAEVNLDPETEECYTCGNLFFVARSYCHVCESRTNTPPPVEDQPMEWFDAASLTWTVPGYEGIWTWVPERPETTETHTLGYARPRIG